LSQISKAEVGILMARGLLAAVVESVLLDNTVAKTLWFVERKENVKQRHIKYYIVNRQQTKRKYVRKRNNRTF